MDGVEFDIDGNQGFGGPSQKGGDAEHKQSFLFNLLAKIGVTDRTVANMILLGFATLCFGITIFVYANGFGSGAAKLSPEMVAAQLRVLSQTKSIK